jgi:RNA-directed DNA polymerase
METRISMMEKDADKMVVKPSPFSRGRRRNRQEREQGASNITAKREQSRPEQMYSMEAVVERENMRRAYAQVMSNGGAAGIDGMSVSELADYLRAHWTRLKAELLEGRYQPQAVRQVEIPKADGKRQLGIPTVVDRLLQQALHQVLSARFDPYFSESSYGFRSGRNAHQAVQQARAYVASGKRWVVDLDLEKFFDRVNHDILMSRVARRVKDKRVLRLIRRYLQAGIMSDGVVSPRTEGTPQGGPLSPLLSNILLDELDKELERRGHAFCRYADDCNIYVQSKAAGERVMKSITEFLSKRLRLRVNASKSAVARPWTRKFLGYSMTYHRAPRLKVAEASVKRLKEKLRVKFREGRGRNLKQFINEELNPLLRGWISYFRLAEVKGLFEELDGWLRRKLRCLLWRHWKRAYTRVKALMKRGFDQARAWKSTTNGRGPWWNAGASHMNEAFPKSYFESLGLVSLLNQLHRFQFTS